MAGDGSTIDLKFESVTNLRSSDERYMGGLEMTFVSPDHVKAVWTSYQRGKDELPPEVFEMHRQK